MPVRNLVTIWEAPSRLSGRVLLDRSYWERFLRPLVRLGVTGKTGLYPGDTEGRLRLQVSLGVIGQTGPVYFLHQRYRKATIILGEVVFEY